MNLFSQICLILQTIVFHYGYKGKFLSLVLTLVLWWSWHGSGSVSTVLRVRASTSPLSGCQNRWHLDALVFKKKKRKWDRNKKMEILALSNKLSKAISGENIVIFAAQGSINTGSACWHGWRVNHSQTLSRWTLSIQTTVMEINCTCDCGRPFNCLCKFHGELLLNSDLHYVYAFVYWLPTILSVLNKKNLLLSATMLHLSTVYGAYLSLFASYHYPFW